MAFLTNIVSIILKWSKILWKEIGVVIIIRYSFVMEQAIIQIIKESLWITMQQNLKI
jgi:hypothetical protein